MNLWVLEDAAIENPSPNKNMDFLLEMVALTCILLSLYELIFQDQRRREKEGLKTGRAETWNTENWDRKIVSDIGYPWSNPVVNRQQKRVNLNSLLLNVYNYI